MAKADKSKNVLFWVITILIPFLFLLLTELVLTLTNYGGNRELFIDAPEGYKNYLQPNPAVAKRYFYNENSVPTPPLQLFKKNKPDSLFRIIVLGGSTTAGFPYGANASFPKYLERALAKSFSDKKIEVINIAMSAVNSYTINDLMDEVLEQNPNLLLLYAGHNEFYGALGVGSVQSLGKYSGIVNLYLKLQKFKTVIALRDFIGWLKASIFSGRDQKNKLDKSSSLMARIVGEQQIAYKSELYELGKKQFINNINSIFEKAAFAKVPMIVGELVSNLNGIKPFADTKGNYSSLNEFNEAVKAEINLDFNSANKHYQKAKDYDALRFRATEEFNHVLDSLSKNFQFPYVKTKTYFAKSSPNGIIGNSLILEHLHPNYKGYNLLARAFFDKIVDLNFFKEAKAKFEIKPMEGLTALDTVYGNLVIKNLKSGWPFKKVSQRNLFFQNFKPKNKIEKLALKVLQVKNFNIAAAHVTLGEMYEKKGELLKALSEYNAVRATIPQEIEFYKKSATIYLKLKNYSTADSLLKISLEIKPSWFALKWIGQIALIDKDYKTAIAYLKSADQNDEQVVFNLSRAYYENSQWNEGERYFRNLVKLNGTKSYINHLKKLRILTKGK